jgi:hypothetical protein
MNVELTAENASALARYAALAGHTPSEFLNRYLTDNMVTLFENPSGDRSIVPVADAYVRSAAQILAIQKI